LRIVLRIKGDIRLEGNQLSGFIPSEFGTLSRLTHLGLEDNRLQGFPSTLGQLTNLERLLLSGNPLNTTIPTEIGQMVRLSEYYPIPKCHIERNQKLTLSSSILKADVEARDALVRGSFPSELGLLPRLSSLNFDNNLLTGAPPLITSSNFGK
jgi:Leucine-rich repeat (LRR) protein